MLFIPRAKNPDKFLQRMSDANIRIVEAPEMLALDGVSPSLQRWMLSLRRVLRRERVDIYHMHSNVQGNEYWSAFAARAAGTRAIVCTYHTQIGPESPQRLAAMRMTHWGLGAHAIAVSSVVRDQVQRHYWPRAGRLAWIPASVEDVVQLPAPPLENPPRLTIGYVGRLEWEKGVDVLIKALAQVSDRDRIRPVIMGEGIQRAELEQMARDLGLGDVVEFRGLVLDAAAHFSEFDVVAIPSHFEGFGMVGAEACAASRPIIATRVGGLIDIVREGENGWLVPPNDPVAFARAIEQAAADPAALQRMGAAARRRYEANWRVGSMATRVAQVYEAALGARARSR
jgi:glycosyltransferase involved in cell wall biosynthesis